MEQIQEVNPEEHLLSVQAQVFEKELAVEERPDIFKFITFNGALFRNFANNLPEEVKEIWGRAAEDESALDKVERAFDGFRSDFEQSLEMMDPDLRTELTQAVEVEDVDAASRIIDAFLTSREEVVA